MTKKEIAPLLREAFDSDSVPVKNIALRRAYDEIERLQNIVLRGLAGVELSEENDRLIEDNKRLRAACERMMIGGNHIATYKTERWPEPGTDHNAALERLGAGREYDMWCCWNAIMCARRALEDDQC